MATSFVFWSAALLEPALLSPKEGAVARVRLKDGQGDTHARARKRVPGCVAVALVCFPAKQPGVTRWEKRDLSSRQGKAYGQRRVPKKGFLAVREDAKASCKG